MPVPKPPVLDVATSNAIAAYQTVIDNFVAANQAVYDQQVALQAQCNDLLLQVNALGAQIAQMETGDVANARAAIRALNMISRGQGQQLARLGL